MSSLLVPGSNTNLAGTGPYTVQITHDPGPVLDLTAFVLGADSRVRSDEDMVFYNQNERTSDGVTWKEPDSASGKTRHTLLVDPSRWPNGIERVRIALTADGTTFGAVSDLQARVLDSGGNVVAEFDLSKRDRENAFIVGEIYSRNGALKVRCVSAGFINGLAGLARDVGVDIEDEPAAPPAQASPLPSQAAPKLNLVKQLAQTPPPANAPAVDLHKHKVAVSLVKTNLDEVIFRVVLAIDASGSMSQLFAKRGGSSGGGGLFSSRNRQQNQLPSVVQCSLERMVPVADLLDDNHEMEVWYFGSNPSRSDSVTIQTMEGYVDRTMRQKNAAGYSNVEPLLMEDIIRWVEENPSPYPTIVLAWSDGGVGNEKQIKKVLVDSSSKPIFWMWLGLGRANYGVLARLDTVQGGVVDNAGFMEIDNIEAMSDDVLYDGIFTNVSQWYRDAKAAGIISASH
jgi:stress response protein SCP2